MDTILIQTEGDKTNSLIDILEDLGLNFQVISTQVEGLDSEGNNEGSLANKEYGSDFKVTEEYKNMINIMLERHKKGDVNYSIVE
jgi:hypothetical protein